MTFQPSMENFFFHFCNKNWIAKVILTSFNNCFWNVFYVAFRIFEI